VATGAKRKEDEDWVVNAKEAHKDFFSELDVLLRSADRFFNLENIPSIKENPAESNFFDELSAIRDVIFRISGLLETIIPEGKRNAYWFQKFAGAKFLTDLERDKIRAELYKQDTAEKSILLLYDSFTNLKTLVADLLKTGTIPYLSYLNVGQILSKEIRENNYFNPFKKEINSEFDIIYNHEISGIVRGIKDMEAKKYISLVMVYLFRLLRYLSHIDVRTQKTISLNTSLVILMLVRSEIEIFRNYIEKIITKISGPDMKALLQSISYQFSMETKRVFQQELRDILKKKASGFFRGRIENSQGILKNLAEQSIIQIATFYKPGLKGEDIFESFTTRLEQSLKLREDLFALHKFLILIQKASKSPEKAARLFESLRNFMLYFESFTFKLLRYGDYEEFVSFFKEILSFKKDRIAGNDLNKFMEKIHNFRIFLETTLRQIANRTELREKPVDMKRVGKLISQYVEIKN